MYVISFLLNSHRLPHDECGYDRLEDTSCRSCSHGLGLSLPTLTLLEYSRTKRLGLHALLLFFSFRFVIFIKCEQWFLPLKNYKQKCHLEIKSSYGLAVSTFFFRNRVKVKINYLI